MDEADEVGIGRMRLARRKGACPARAAGETPFPAPGVCFDLLQTAQASSLGKGIVPSMKPLSTIALKGRGLPLWLAVGHFIFRAPARLKRMDLPLFLLRLSVSPRGRGDYARIERLTRRWLRLPGLQGRNTCYLRSLVLFRFLDPGDADLCLHFGIDEPESPEERLHGHAWVSLDRIGLNPPPYALQGRLREIYRFSFLNGGSSTSGAKFAGAMFQNDVLYPEPEPPKRV